MFRFFKPIIFAIDFVISSSMFYIIVTRIGVVDVICRDRKYNFQYYGLRPVTYF